MALWVGAGVVAAVLAVFLGWALFVPAADWLARHDIGNVTGASLETARNNARGNLLALTAGIAGFGALIFTARNFALQRRALALSQRSFEENAQLARRTLELTQQGQQRTHELTEQGQVTERYTKAIEQLGSEKLDIRIGGIYALERIARDSVRDDPTVMEVLTTFIRQHSSVREVPGRDAVARSPRVEADMQAALIVIGRRKAQDIARIKLPGAKLSRADLVHADLTGVDLAGANLIEADLTRVDLTGVDLADSILGGANLTAAYLADANLTGANLSYAILVAADLQHADLTRARLDHASLTRALLHRATLVDADLKEVDLTAANLTYVRAPGANLRRANLTSADLTEADLTNADLRGANLTSAKLDRTNLTNADLTAANLISANLDRTNLTNADLTRVNLNGAELKGAFRAGFAAPAGWRVGDDGRMERVPRV
jgi:uncharacterized protein YjbI with pentapeptide repeats